MLVVMLMPYKHICRCTTSTLTQLHRASTTACPWITSQGQYRILISTYSLTLRSDSLFNCANYELASYITSYSVPVYRYLFNHAYQEPGLWGPKYKAACINTYISHLTSA